MQDLTFVGIITGALIILYVSLVILSTVFKKPTTKRNPQYYVDNVDSLNVSHEEFYKVLNFMLMYGIIDLEEYNKIQSKGLPYTG